MSADFVLAPVVRVHNEVWVAKRYPGDRRPAEPPGKPGPTKARPLADNGDSRQVLIVRGPIPPTDTTGFGGARAHLSRLPDASRKAIIAGWVI